MQNSPSPNSPSHEVAPAGRAIAAISKSIRDLADVVRQVADPQYVQKPVGSIAGSIGGHVRHCLDHLRAILVAIETRELDYDHRERGTPIETDRSAAINECRDLEARFADLPTCDLSQAIVLKTSICASQSPIVVQTSIGRELAFVQSHTIHHNAMIAAMLKTLGCSIPDEFGYAPSTLDYLAQSACVPSR